MTKQESDHLMKLSEMMGDLRESVAVLTQRIDNVIELGNMNGVLIKTQLQGFINRCDERHDAVLERICHLERSERKSYGLRNKLQGMTAPAAVLVSIVALLVNFLR